MAKSLKLIRLWELARGSEIHGLEVRPEGMKPVKNIIIIFDHTDGLYSFNTIKDEKGKKVLNKNGNQAIVHLGNSLILKKVDGHYEVASEEEAKNYKD